MDETLYQMIDGERLAMTDEEAAEFRASLEAPVPSATIVFPADLWRRTTEDEAERIEGAMAAQPARLRNLFRSASTYQSDDPLWPVLVSVAENLFGEERAAELLAPST